MSETWAEKVAARMGEASATEAQEGRSGDPVPAWSRVVVDRVMGRESAPEDLAAVQQGQRRPRTAFERALLERLGYAARSGGLWCTGREAA